MNCNDFNTGIITYLEGQLPAESIRQFELHMNSCTECSQRFSILQSTWEQISAEKNELQPNPYLAQRVWARVQPLSAPVIPFRLKTIATLVAAGLALGIAIGSLAESANFNQTETTWEQLAEDYFPSESLSPFDNVTNNQ